MDIEYEKCENEILQIIELEYAKGIPRAEIRLRGFLIEGGSVF